MSLPKIAGFLHLKRQKHIKRHMKEGEGENNSSITETSDKKWIVSTIHETKQR